MRDAMARSRLPRVFPWLTSALLQAGAATGHDTWVLPGKSAVPPNTSVTLEVTSGMSFPALEVAVTPDRLDRTGLRLAGTTTPLANTHLAEKSLRVTAALSQTGIATLWVESKPRATERTSEQMSEYLDEIGADEAIRREWRDSGRETFRGHYTKHAKTFIRVGELQQDQSWGKPVGMRLEILPEKDPTTLSIGDEVSFRVLREGKPLPGFALAAVAAGEKRTTMHRTDEQGRVSFQFDRKGWWMLKGTELRRSAGPEADWESRFTTLTFEVRP